MKKKLVYIMFATVFIAAFIGCGSTKTSEEGVSETLIEDNKIEDSIPVQDTSSVPAVENEITEDSDLSAAEAFEPEEDLSGLPHIEIQPILDILDDVWGKNWMEWTSEEFIDKYGLTLQHDSYYCIEGQYGTGTMHADLLPDNGFIISEHGQREAVLAVKSISEYGGQRTYTRILSFDGDMQKDSMTAYFRQCPGCEENDPSKCRAENCVGCERNNCEDCTEEECGDCVIKDCRDLLKFWGVEESGFVATEYGKANLSIDIFDQDKDEDEWDYRLYLTGFTQYPDLIMSFESGDSMGMVFWDFVIMITADDKLPM